jgi:2-dehydropantoate 2-reductase
MANINLANNAGLSETLPKSADVIGAGGIGICIAMALHRAGCQVRLVEKSASKVRRGSSEGVQIHGFPPEPIPLVAFQDWIPSPNAPLFLCIKGYHNSQALEKICPNIPVIPIQNGFDPELAERTTSLEGIASWISECDPEAPQTRITRRGDFHFGPAQGVSTPGISPPGEASLVKTARSWLEAIGPHLISMGIRPRLTNDIRPYKASKLIYNAAISPIASAAGIDNSLLLTDPQARRWFFALLRENIAIMQAKNIPLGKVGPFLPSTVAWILGKGWLRAPLARFFAPSLRGTYCSMALDFAKGETEIDHYNGHLIRLAGNDKLCPVNRLVVHLAKVWLDAGRAPSREFLNELDQLGKKEFGPVLTPTLS